MHKLPNQRILPLQGFQVVTKRSYCYSTTRPNLMLSRDTKIICQGFTGKVVSIITHYIAIATREIHVEYFLLGVGHYNNHLKLCQLQIHAELRCQN